ncbi:MAG: AGE family epimerase/isomerase [Gammaproteobacteria bacterium]|nr:AGE family epimerase/isomerase [Gammaproteobacteria bacterium]
MDTPDFSSSEFLSTHIKQTLAFYHPQCIDRKSGGFYHYFRDNGEIYDTETRHLVSSARFVFNYAMAASNLHNSVEEQAAYLEATQHGIRFLRRQHLDPDLDGYAWVLHGDTVIDGTNHCYGLAFVLLAYATALKAGIQEAKQYLEECFNLMERHFWDTNYGLYRDEISADWKTVSTYRGQNANMHSCEAMIAAYQATGNEVYLDRAFTVAHNICVRQANLSDGMIWEHYHEDWRVDPDYNREDPKNLFRPWGFQPGHFTEWAKLLLLLREYRKEEWLLPLARGLFDTALGKAWDFENGGICYGFAPDGSICDSDKYFWVQAESLAAAAMLGEALNNNNYRDWYQRIWNYSWNHMIDHEYGAWYRILNRQNEKYDALKSPAGKTDYHTMGACYEALRTLHRDKTGAQYG